MAFNKDRYKQLKELGGFTAKEANIFARKSQKKVNDLIGTNILHMLEKGEKITKKKAYEYARFFGFNSKDAGRLRGFSAKNLYTSIITHTLPNVGDLVVSRDKDGIKFLSAYSAGRYQQKNYLYEVQYYVDTGFTSTKKYVTVTSNKKLSKKEVYNHIVDTQFPKHEEEYESVPLPNTIEIVKAYYITANERKKIIAEKDAEYNAKKTGTRSKSGKK